MTGFNPTHYVMAGDGLVASILRTGNGRPGSPRRFLVYWSTRADLLNPPKIERPTARQAYTDAMAWGRKHFDAVRVERRARY
jgi:hypothetical protein